MSSTPATENSASNDMGQSSPGLPDQLSFTFSHPLPASPPLLPVLPSCKRGNHHPDTPTPPSSPGKKKARALRITSVPPTSNRVDPIQFETTYVPASTTHSTTPSDIFSDHMELAMADLPELSRWDDGSSVCDDDERTRFPASRIGSEDLRLDGELAQQKKRLLDREKTRLRVQNFRDRAREEDRGRLNTRTNDKNG
jgi:hypothetical protein